PRTGSPVHGPCTFSVALARGPARPFAPGPPVSATIEDSAAVAGPEIRTRGSGARRERHRQREAARMGSTVRTAVREDLTPSRPGPASDRRARAVRGILSWDLAFLTALALIVRLIQLDHTVQVDELNHIFAARSLLEDGTLQIGDDGGLYTRAWDFTYVVAAAFALLGESVVVARIPAMLAGTALVAVLFAWTRSVAGRGAAWLAALFLCFDPTAIFLSQFNRFYTIHALLFLLGAIAVFSLCTQPASPRRRIGLGLAALAAFALAYHLQVTTMVGVAGVTA